jgi:all-trans-nonaprenyl-diphosphate synthase
VDDILDFTASTEALGKPAGSDLISGNLTLPVLYALEEKPYLEVLIEREFAQPDDLEQALDLVKESHGIERSRELAAHHAQIAVQNAISGGRLLGYDLGTGTKLLQLL